MKLFHISSADKTPSRTSVPLSRSGPDVTKNETTDPMIGRFAIGSSILPLRHGGRSGRGASLQFLDPAAVSAAHEGH